MGGSGRALRAASGCLVGLSWLAGCVVDPNTVLESAPRVAIGDEGVQLVRDPCSRSPSLVAPVEIDARPAWLLIDSGAFRHTFSGEYVRKHGLPMTTERIRVGDGEGMDAWVLGPLDLTMPGVGSLPSTQVLSLDNAIVGTCGTAGVLSPQQAVSDGKAVVVDLQREELRVLPAEVARASLSGAWLTPEDGLEPNDWGAYFIEAFVGGVPARLLLDTGACCTVVYSGSEAGKHLASAAGPTQTGPRDIMNVVASRIALGVSVRSQSVSRAVDVHLMDRQRNVEDGILGVDFLKECSIVFEKTRSFARCQSTH